MGAMPNSIMENNIKIVLMSFGFTVCLPCALFLSLTSTFEDLFDPDRKYVIHIANKSWSLHNLCTTAYWNITIFYGRILWTGFMYPTSYALLRSLVKDASVKVGSTKGFTDESASSST